MSDVNQKRSNTIFLFVGCFLLIAGFTTASAAENILGEWEFTMDMGDMGGMGGGMNITINSNFTKGSDGAITGTWEMAFDMPEGDFGGGMGGPGGGGFEMPTFKIVDVKIDGQNLSFTRKAEGEAGVGMGGGMMTEDRQFTGTIKGDTIELTSSSQMGEMTYKGTRKAAQENILGDWEFTMDLGDMGGGMGPSQMTINSTFSAGDDGAITGTWEMVFEMPEGDMGGGGFGGDMGGFQMPVMKVIDVKIEGQKLTFTQTMEMPEGDMGGMGMGGDFSSTFTGTISGDKIEGTMESMMGAMPLTGTRKGAAAATAAAPAGLEGGWTFVTTFGDMGMEIRAKVAFKKAADGTYSGTWESLPMEGMGDMGMGDFPAPTTTISDIKLDGDKVTFVQKVDLTDMGMGEMVSNYTGTLKDDKIEGALSSEMGESTSIGTRNKVAGAAGDDVLAGNWEFKMEMGDMGGMGMGPMEFIINSTFTKAADGTYAGTWERQIPEGQEGGFGGGMGGDFEPPTVTLEDIKLDGNKLTFVQKISFGEGGGMGMGDMSSTFTGTIEDGKITGAMASEMMGEMPITGTKK